MSPALRCVGWLAQGMVKAADLYVNGLYGQVGMNL